MLCCLVMGFERFLFLALDLVVILCVEIQTNAS